MVREVSSVLHGPLIVEIRGDALTIRQKGKRTRFVAPWGVLYERAAEAARPQRRRIRRGLL